MKNKKPDTKTDYRAAWSSFKRAYNEEEGSNEGKTFVCFVCGDREEVGQGGCYVDMRTGEQHFDRPICVACNDHQNDDCYDDDY